MSRSSGADDTGVQASKNLQSSIIPRAATLSNHATQGMRRGETPIAGTRAGTFARIVAIVLLGIVAGGCFALGMWQLGRAEERDALSQLIEQGRRQPPLTLSTASAADELIPWRSAQAQGHWLPHYTVLLENRNLDGRPGYWVATPLVLAQAALPATRNDAITAGSSELDALAGYSTGGEFLSRGPGAGSTAVLVLRGWLPRDMQAGGAPPQVPAEPTAVSVRGELHAHVPRIFELWEWAGGKASQLPASLPAPNGTPPVVQNLELAEFARASGLQLLPVVLAQTHESIALGGDPAGATPADTTAGGNASALLREWPGPSLDSDQNRGYALQWFSFSAIAAAVALFMIWGLLRRAARNTAWKDS